MSKPLSDRELLSRLVGFDSTSRESNLPIADFICEYVDGSGVQIDRQSSPDGRKANIIINIGPTGLSDHSGLVLSGHMDTVPSDEPEWRTNPLALQEENGTYVGRGTCDMKGFIALAMNAALSIDPTELTHPLVLVFTYDEEIGILGAKQLAGHYEHRGVLPSAAIIGEPTSLRVVRLHKGYLEFRITLTGKSAHSGYPHLGQSAIEPLGRLIPALVDLRKSFKSDTPPNREFFPEVPYVAFNIGRIEGGTATNIVPDKCLVECSARPLPGMDDDEVGQRVREVVEKALIGCEFQITPTKQSPPLLLAAQSQIYEFLCGQVQQAETHSASYATDAGWLQTLGMDCAIFGPGSIEAAHRPNESIPIEEFERASAILKRTIQHFCLDAR